MTDGQDRDHTVGNEGEEDFDATVDYVKNIPAPSGVTGGLGGNRVEPGTMIGRYKIESCLDHGGMGIVYRARHTALGKTVALKVVSTMLQSEPRATERFLREMQAIGGLEPHPNVLNAYDAGDENGIQYIATELIEGIQLAALIKRIGPLSVSEACKIVSQAALALEHLRKHHLVHRDIKPSNLMLTRDGTVKVVDMGLALLRDDQADQITMTGEAMGSIDYMAPEQWIDSHSVDWRSDVYSLGCTFYCLLSGHAPYSREHKGSASRMRAHLDTPFPDIRNVRGDVPAEAVSLLEAMVRKDPKNRQSELVEISEKLELIASGDLKGLVQRGFRPDEIQPLQYPPRQPAIGPKGAGLGGATEPHPLVADSQKIDIKKRRKAYLLTAVLLAGCVVGLIAGVHYLGDPGVNRDLHGLMGEASGPASVPDARANSPREAASGSTAIEGDSDAVAPQPSSVIHCPGHQARIMDLTFLGDSPVLASVDEDGTLLITDLAEPSEPVVLTQPQGFAFAGIDYDPKTKRIYIVTQNGSLQIRSARDGSLIDDVALGTGGFTSVSRPSDRDELISSDWGGNVRLLDLSTTPIGNRVLGTRGEVVYDTDMTADGKFVGWVGRDPEVSLFNTMEQKLVNLKGHTGWVYELAFSPDGKRLVSVGHEGAIRVVDVPDWDLIAEFQYQVPQAVAFLPDSDHIVVGGRGRQVDVWNVATRRKVQTVDIGRPIDCVSTSADGKWIAAGCADGTLKVWQFDRTP